MYRRKGWANWQNELIARALLGGVLHAVGRGEVEPGLLQPPPPLLDVRPLHPHHDRHGDLEGPGRADDTVGQDVAAEDAAEDVDQDGADVPVGGGDTEGV